MGNSVTEDLDQVLEDVLPSHDEESSEVCEVELQEVQLIISFVWMFTGCGMVNASGSILDLRRESTTRAQLSKDAVKSQTFSEKLAKRWNESSI